MQTGLTLSLIGVILAWIGYRQRDTIKPEVREKLSRLFWHYCWGAFSNGTNGANVSLKAFVGVAVGASASAQTVQTPNADMVLYIFGTAFALNALDWFIKNPLPTNLIETTTTTETITATETTRTKPPITP
jgi:hypothetical protein